MNEKISALMDGELSPNEAARQIITMKTDKGQDRAWVIYHVLGDAMRKSPQLSLDFTDKLSQMLAKEPTVLAPHARKSRTPAYAMPLAASLAAVSLVGVLSWQMTRVSQADVTIAQTPTPAAIAQQVAIAQPSTAVNKHDLVQFSRVVSNPYLLAHQEFSPSYAMEGIPAYVRTVSELQETAR